MLSPNWEVSFLTPLGGARYQLLLVQLLGDASVFRLCAQKDKNGGPFYGARLTRALEESCRARTERHVRGGGLEGDRLKGAMLHTCVFWGWQDDDYLRELLWVLK